MRAETTCCICKSSQTADKPLHRCYNPHCRNWVCARHALSFELHDDAETHIEYFCSRRCYIQMQQRTLPPQRELMIALLVLAVIIPIYLTVVAYFTR